jgi:hypothetical protein
MPLGGVENESDLGRMAGDRRGPAVRAAFLAGLGNPGLHAVAQDVPLELGEDGKHAGQRPSARGGQVERLAERDEADLEYGQFLKRHDQIDQGASPAIQPPDQDQVKFSASGRSEQLFPFGTLADARADILHLQDDAPSATPGMVPHGRELQGQRLLVVRRDAGIKADARGRTPLAKNPSSAVLGKPLFLRGFGHAVAVWLKTIVSSHTVQPPIP